MEESDNSQQLDFDAMTEEELEAYLKGSGQANEPETEDETDPKTGQPEDEEKESDNSDIEPDQKNDNTDNDELPADPQYSRYAGKGKKELIDMVLNGTKKISEQGNVIHDFKTRLEAIERAGKNTTEVNLEGYDKNDLSAIESVAYRQALAAIKHTEQERINIREQEIKTAREENDKAWLFTKSLFPEKASAIEAELIKELQSDPDSTINVSGWAQNRIRELINDNSKSVNQSLKKKVVTRPFNGGVLPGPIGVQSKLINLNVEPSDPEEYLEWYKQKHGVDLRKK